MDLRLSQCVGGFEPLTHIPNKQTTNCTTFNQPNTLNAQWFYLQRCQVACTERYRILSAYSPLFTIHFYALLHLNFTIKVVCSPLLSATTSEFSMKGPASPKFAHQFTTYIPILIVFLLIAEFS